MPEPGVIHLFGNPLVRAAQGGSRDPAWLPGNGERSWRPRPAGGTRVTAHPAPPGPVLGGGLIGTCIGVGIVVIFAAAQNWTALLNPVYTLPAPLIGSVVGLLAGAIRRCARHGRVRSRPCSTRERGTPGIPGQAWNDGRCASAPAGVC